MKNTSRFIGLLVFLGLLGIGIYAWRKHHSSSTTNTVARDKQIETDKKVLEDPKAKEPDVQLALMRLSEVHDDQARAEVFKRAKSNDLEQRKGAARALGFFTDKEALDELTRLLDDPEASIRVATIQALSFRRSPEREALFAKVLTNSQATDAEKILALGALARSPTQTSSSADPTHNKHANIEQIFTLAQSNAKNPATLGMAVRELSGLAPRDERLQKIINDILTTPAPKSATPSALADHERMELLNLAITGLHQTCPKNRAELIKGIFSREKDPMVLRGAIQELTFLDKTVSQKLLDEAVAKKWIPDNFQPSPDMIRTRLQNSNLRDPCTNPILPPGAGNHAPPPGFRPGALPPGAPPGARPPGVPPGAFPQGVRPPGALPPGVPPRPTDFPPGIPPQGAPPKDAPAQN